MMISRRTFGLGMALSGLAACGAPGAARLSSSGPTPLADDLRPVANPGYDAWVAAFRDRAGQYGLSDETVSAAFRGAGYLPGVITRDRNQTEFRRSLEDYLSIAVSDERVAKGRAAFAAHRATLAALEARYGVDARIITAIWGLESFYGERRGDVPVISATSTLAYDGRRGAFFESQLVAALKILRNGDTTPARMTGSWAGAMGHTQFIPTSYLSFAVDFTGDGKRDIWSDDPSDALASTAAYLARSGWRKGAPWGVEVTLPEGFDFGLTGERVTKPAAEWAGLGVRDMQGREVGDHGPASILMPTGARGAAFMIFPNFHAIERYNTADAYVIAVGHLADRIAGGAPIRAAWPREDRVLVFAERRELQERLTRAGFDTGGVDGRIGPNTIAAVRAFQRASGLLPDGYASLDILRRLR